MLSRNVLCTRSKAPWSQNIHTANHGAVEWTEEPRTFTLNYTAPAALIPLILLTRIITYFIFNVFICIYFNRLLHILWSMLYIFVYVNVLCFYVEIIWFRTLIDGVAQRAGTPNK